MDQSTDIDKWLALANGEDGDKQLAIAAGIDLNDEDAQSKIDGVTLQENLLPILLLRIIIMIQLLLLSTQVNSLEQLILQGFPMEH